MASLEKRCLEKDEEIGDLKRRINDKLEDEKQEAEQKEAEHEQETKSKLEKNLATRKSLSDILKGLNQNREDDE
jgi:hypothetical protein